MINISRQSNSPNSLNTPEIKQFIDDAIRFVNKESEIKPQIPVSYRNSDLLDAFDRNFYSKCYLTEIKHFNSYIMDIEHFLPKSERPDLTYNWHNLFPADHYSNMIKPRKTPPGGYLDPCNPAEDVQDAIIYTLSPFGEDPDFEARDTSCQKAVNTCELLKRVHNGHDDNTKKATENLRCSIRKRYVEILKKIIIWQKEQEGTQQKVQAKRELKEFLSIKSSFTMLMRSMPAVQHLPEDFFD